MTTSPTSTAASATAIRAAIKGQRVEELDFLLSAGANPNPHPDGANAISGTSEDWMVTDDGYSALQFDRDSDGCYPPLRLAAAIRIVGGPEKRQEQAKMMKMLLEHGADLYALFHQPFYPTLPYTRSNFPGEREPAEYRTPPYLRTYSSSGCWPVRRYPIAPLGNFPGFGPPEVEGTTYPWELNSDNCWSPWGDYWEIEDPDDNEDDPPIQYGLRSVIHSILEDGLFCQPIIQLVKDHTLSLNLEHHNPQGCTILLSACQSNLGADARVEGTVCDTAWDVHEGRLFYDPFPPKQTYDLPLDESTITGTTLHALLSLGANPLATDNHGRNALHHLLEADNHRTKGSCNARAPRIRTSLNYFASRFPALLNQPDNNGTYPLHAALHRLRRYPLLSNYTISPGVSPKGCILDLISLKGINGERVPASVRDRRGNTALHYIADEGLLEARNGAALRSVLRALLDHPEIKNNKDFINVRNDEGRTAIELMLDNNGWRDEQRFSLDPHYRDGSPNDIETEVLVWLDSAGADWLQRDGRGGTLLHIVASHATERAAFRCQFLLTKGVDPSVSDMDSETALDVAVAHANHDVIRLLKSRREKPDFEQPNHVMDWLQQCPHI